MKNHHGWLSVRLLASAGALLLMYLVIAAPTQRSSAAEPAGPKLVAQAPLMLTLEDCLRTAYVRQPALVAQRSSLAASEDGRRALLALHVPTVLVPELPIRRAQADLGVNASAAALLQVEYESFYAVVRCYFTVLYAREQERVAHNIVERLTAVGDAAKQMLDGGARDVTTSDVDKLSIYLDLAETRRIQAANGVERALAALKEAVGLDGACRINIPDGKLPEPNARPSREIVVALALDRRPELIQANCLVELTCLEIDAQRSKTNRKVETFAVGGDLHSRPVSQEVREGSYRPGAIAPEMPAMLVGCQLERVIHARALNARAIAACDKARNLIILETEDAFLRWEEASQKIVRVRRAFTSGDRLADNLGKDFAAAQKIKVEEVINAQVLAAQARSQYLEFLHQQILALADLERATAGGFSAGLVATVQLPGPPLQEKNQSTSLKQNQVQLVPDVILEGPRR